MRRILVTVLLFSALGGACGKDKVPSAHTTTSAAAPSGLSYYDGPPPWPLDGQQVKHMEAAGITPLSAEGSVVHYHAHLDVFYDGERVPVPENVGVDYDAKRISPVHTHTDAGVIHIEANKDEQFTLGQFLSEWGVKARDGRIADKSPDEIAVFVNGSIQDQSATGIVIKAGDEIALVLGTKPPTDIPSSYDCSKRPDDACPTA